MGATSRQALIRVMVAIVLSAFAVMTAVAASVTDHASAAKFSIQHDVPYLDDHRKEKLDIYLPKHDVSRPLPAVLLIHGGGWAGGDKADRRGVSISSDLANSGFAVFAINYRLDKTNAKAGSIGAFPQNVYDCKSALRFMRRYANRYGINPDRIAVMGESAGGHLALLLGETMQNSDLNRSGLYLEQSNRVSCIVDLYGVADLRDPQMNVFRTHFRGRDDSETEANLNKANPIAQITPSLPPILILHGTDDRLVPVEQSRLLASELRAKGVDSKFIEVPGAHHSFDLHPAGVDLRPVVAEFLSGCL